jgi:hypothetical protein
MLERDLGGKPVALAFRTRSGERADHKPEIVDPVPALLARPSEQAQFIEMPKRKEPS